ATSRQPAPRTAPRPSAEPVAPATASRTDHSPDAEWRAANGWPARPWPSPVITRYVAMTTANAPNSPLAAARATRTVSAKFVVLDRTWSTRPHETRRPMAATPAPRAVTPEAGVEALPSRRRPAA